MAYTLIWEENGVYCRFTGLLSAEEIIQCSNEISGDIRFDDIKYQLIDILDVTELAIKTIDVRVVAAYDRAAALTNPKVKCALVTIDKDANILFGVYQNEILKSPWEGLSFTTIKEARAWLISDSRNNNSLQNTILCNQR